VKGMEITEVFCFVDDFVKALEKTKQGKEILNRYRAKRGPQRQLSPSEVITLNLVYKYSQVGNLKAFVRNAHNICEKGFARMPSYVNMVKAFNRSLELVSIFIKYLMLVNIRINADKTAFIDSTTVSVCKTWNVSSHKVTKGYASWGKTTRGWNYGFKLHASCDREGRLVGLVFSTGSTSDSKMAEAVTEGFKGTVVGDAGYILRQEVFQRLLDKHVHMLFAKRKNMKGVMTKGQEKLFGERNVIETVWSVLKGSYGLISHTARSIVGLMRHYCYSILSYMLHKLFHSRPLILPDQT